MSLRTKAKTAIRVYREKGPEGVWQVLQMKLDRRYHPDETAIAFSLLDGETQIGTMLDVGAHHGGSLALFARAGWQVFAFEPDPDNRKLLEDSFGNLPNVSVCPCAVSDQPCEHVMLYRSDESNGVSGLSAFLPTHQPCEEVAVTTLGVFMQNLAEPPEDIDFLKIDTEGYDLMVLKGFPWEREHPRLILCEFEDAKTLPLGYSFHQMATFLKDKGYHLLISEWQPIQKYGTYHHWKRFSLYPTRLSHARAWGNIFAVKDQQLFERLLTLCPVN